MLQRVLRSQSPLRIELQQSRRHRLPLADVVQPRPAQPQLTRRVELQLMRLIPRQSRDARPVVLRGRAERSEYLIQLIVRIAHSREYGHAGNHLDEYTPDAPHVQRRRILGASEQNVRRAVPQRDDLVRIRMARDRLRPRQPEIGQFQLARLAYQQVLRLDVPMQHATLVAIRQPAEQLK